MNQPDQLNRRKFLGRVGATGAAVAAGVVGLEPLLGSNHSTAQGAETGPTGSNQRANQCAKLRRDMAEDGRRSTPPNLQHPTNDDEDIYPNKLGNYSKGLLHNDDGTVDSTAYATLIRALSSGRQQDFNNIQLGGQLRLTNPQAGLAFDLEGADAHALVQPPPPAFASREIGAEIAENYWMALLRDMPFSEYGAVGNDLAQAAAADLTQFGDAFKGPKKGGAVTPATLFRGLTPGDLQGPYLSQFFYQPCHFGANEIDQKITTAASGVNYMTDFNTWLAVQRGLSQPAQLLDGTLRYMRNGRDIGQWVHIDVLFQAYFQAFLCIAGLGTPVDDNNPYRNNPTQDGFGTFGGPHIATLLCEVSTRALKSVWYQKWFVHRRLRPEVFAARCDRMLYHNAGYPVDQEILTSLSTHSRLGGYLPAGNALLPMAFPEGSPAHPAYGAGHATVAGACVTILKAWFKESTELVNLGATPVQPNDDGTALIEYEGGDTGELTVGGELNKIAANVALGRNIAGVHWRSDATESLKLGEEVAIRLLREQRGTYNEAFSGFKLTKFDGSPVVV
ncbi:MAG: vanadium-dependent haloperoxidase [Pyrinomonadaceae bacterium]|nr:vanadium-dependent haloperoxidase [Pyrinomonadaceae bacterium]